MRLVNPSQILLWSLKVYGDVWTSFRTDVPVKGPRGERACVQRFAAEGLA